MAYTEQITTRTVAGRMLGLLIPGALLVWLAATVVLVALPELKVALGHAGTPGTATVVSCDALGHGRFDCRASFEFDDRFSGPIVVGTVPDVEVGEVFPAALTPAGDRVLPTGARGVWRQALVLGALPLGVAVIALLTVVVKRSRK
ncbi:hypothetical protein [Nonomuraea sp. SBT364]|uniref:hypothetical protein n=1 Tax=Nonomuraea sp. SBT364 TaxID=1580530 RepID=UPI0012E1B2B8|nr:hypothetical protein [Nonomuraea sp. SBT364]